MIAIFNGIVSKNVLTKRDNEILLWVLIVEQDTNNTIIKDIIKPKNTKTIALVMEVISSNITQSFNNNNMK